jgi:hypothetical protein
MMARPMIMRTNETMMARRTPHLSASLPSTSMLSVMPLVSTPTMLWAHSSRPSTPAKTVSEK